MRRWHAGPSVGLVILLAIAVWGVLTSPPLTGVNQSLLQTVTNDQPVTVGTWVRDNREVIEPLTAIGALIIAAVVAYVTTLLYLATRKLAVSTEDLANAAHEQFTEMGLARALTERTLDLQEKQFLLAGRQCDLAEKQHGLQREQYIAEYRPRIKIRSIGLTRPSAGDLFQSGRVLTGSLVIVNIGASDATIRQADYRFFCARDGLPMVPPLEPHQVNQLFANMLPHTIAGHESCLIPVESDGPLGEEARGILLGGPYHLYLMGAVLFSDWNLKERWMGFCQKYTTPKIAGGDGRFVPVDNPDYEYED
jgi:hypothetical protein